ncbi:MAG: restriction endonuclease, partial [Halobacteria archaeon]|nr:restriction endonuclease [Halobacteria archaeon]
LVALLLEEGGSASTEVEHGSSEEELKAIGTVTRIMANPRHVSPENREGEKETKPRRRKGYEFITRSGGEEGTERAALGSVAVAAPVHPNFSPEAFVLIGLSVLVGGFLTRLLGGGIGEEYEERYEELESRAERLGDGGVPPALKDDFEGCDPDNFSSEEEAEEALDELEDRVGEYRSVAGRHSKLAEKVRSMRDEAGDSELAFELEEVLDTVVEALDGCNPSETTDIDETRNRVEEIGNLVGMIDRLDLTVLEEFPVQSGALEGEEPENLYGRIESAQGVGEIRKEVRRLREVIRYVNENDLNEMSERLDEFGDEELTDDVSEALRNGDVDEVESSAEVIDKRSEIEEKKQEITDRLETLETEIEERADTELIRERVEEVNTDRGVTAANNTLGFYETAVDLLVRIEDLNRSEVPLPTREVETELDSALGTGPDGDENRHIERVERRVDDLEEVREKYEEVERHLENIDFETTDSSEEEIRDELEEYAENGDLSEMNKLAGKVRKMSQGVWRTRNFMKYTPDDFESLVENLWEDTGYSVTSAEGGNPGVVDMVAENDDEKVVVRTRKLDADDLVTEGDIRETVEERRSHGADRVVVVTTSGFTGQASEITEEVDEIELVDGSELADRLTESSLSPPS